jgi:hypothetical protein
MDIQTYPFKSVTSKFPDGRPLVNTLTARLDNDILELLDKD